MSEQADVVVRKVYDPNKGTYRELKYPARMSTAELQRLANSMSTPTGPLQPFKGRLPTHHAITGEPLE